MELIDNDLDFVGKNNPITVMIGELVEVDLEFTIDDIVEDITGITFIAEVRDNAEALIANFTFAVVDAINGLGVIILDTTGLPEGNFFYETWRDGNKYQFGGTIEFIKSKVV